MTLTPLGRPRRLFCRWREAIDSARYCPPQLLQLRAGAVMTHTNVVDDALDRLLPMPQLALPATALVDLVVTVPPAGKRLPVRCIGFQVGCLSNAVPQAVFRACSDLRGDCSRIELGIEHVLQIVYVVLTVVVIAEQIPYQWDLRGVAVHLAGPVEDVGVLPLRTGVVDSQTVVVVPGDEVEI